MSEENKDEILNETDVTNEATNDTATPEAHSDYHPSGVKDEEGKLQLTGMYQNWFLDYASYVILERAVPHLGDGLKPVQRRILHSPTVMPLLAMPWYSWDKRTYSSTVRVTGVTYSRATALLPLVILKRDSQSSLSTYSSILRQRSGRCHTMAVRRNPFRYP